MAVLFQPRSHGKRNPDSDALIEKLAKALELDNKILYYLARKLPPEDVKKGVADKDVVAAFQAFRKKINS